MFKKVATKLSLEVLIVFRFILCKTAVSMLMIERIDLLVSPQTLGKLQAVTKLLRLK